MMTDSCEIGRGLVVLPAIRLQRLCMAVDAITGDSEMTRRVMVAVEREVEEGAYRWGNACPRDECGAHLASTVRGFVCPTHGFLDHTSGTQLLIAFQPSKMAASGGDAR